MNAAFDPAMGAGIASSKKILHFPMQISKDYRYLAGVPALLGTTRNKALRLSVAAWMRDNLHYVDRFFKEASTIIDHLGGVGAYEALHIRRNDLQYKDQFISGAESARIVARRLKPNSVIYLATDETAPDFFQAFEHMGFEVRRMQDFAIPLQNGWHD